jgi:hypothetical protein
VHRQVLYNLSYAPSPFCFSYFSFVPYADLNLLFTLLIEAGMLGAHCHTQLLLVELVLMNFLPGLQTAVVLIASTCVVRITGISH